MAVFFPHNIFLGVAKLYVFGRKKYNTLEDALIYLKMEAVIFLASIKQ
jgi:hypothetical protein